MIPPQDADWAIAYRNKNQTAFAKYGANTDETYGININVFEMPTFDSKEDFLSYILKERNKDSDPKRFKIIKHEQSYYNKRKDFCAKFYYIVKDTKAIKRSRLKGDMILDVVGYTCRLPENKNIGINFSYSKRSYPGNTDSNIDLKSSEYFKLLDF